MLQKLSARHREIARLFVAGLTPAQVAAKLGMTTVGIKAITESALFQQLYGELSCEADSEVVKAKRELDALLPKAVEVVKAVLDTKEADTALKLKTAWDIFDRRGLAPVKEVKVEQTNLNDVSDSELLDRVEELDEQLRNFKQTINRNEEGSKQQTENRPSGDLDSSPQAESLH